MRDSDFRFVVPFGLTLLWSMSIKASSPDDEVHPNSAMRYAAVDYQSDAERNTDGLASLSVTLGNNWWVQVNGGKSRSEQRSASGATEVKAVRAGAGVGVATDHWMTRLGYASRRDGSEYNQRDLNLSVEWNTVRAALALDVMSRKSDINAVSRLVGPNGGTLDIPFSTSIKGSGFGAHGHFNITEELSIQAGGMSYHNSTGTAQNGAVVVNGNVGGVINTLVNNYLNNRPQLAQRLLTRASAVSRAEQTLDHSFDLGIGYQFSHAGLTLQYINDKPIDSDDNAITAQLSAVILLDEHWAISPVVGRTSTAQFGNVGYGGLSITFGW